MKQGYSEAGTWYCKAANKGNADLGIIYIIGDGVKNITQKRFVQLVPHGARPRQ
jgi:TPR repeat protein